MNNPRFIVILLCLGASKLFLGQLSYTDSLFVELDKNQVDDEKVNVLQKIIGYYRS